MSRGQTFSTIILTTSLLSLAVSANLRNHILHINHVDTMNADANPNDKSHDIVNAADHIGKAINGIANAANTLVNNLANALKPNKDNFTEFPRSALVQEFIMAHNEIRRAENIKSLVWNDTMAQLAEDWAKKQDHDCGMRHSSYHGMGENLFWGYNAHWLPREAVHDWAHEKQYYNKEKRECEPNQTCDHYTQVIWKDTEQVGCARYKCSNGNLLVVCEYYPPGNWAGMYPYNPIPLSQLAHYNLSTTAPSLPASSNSSHTSSPPSSPPSSNSHASPPSSSPLPFSNSQTSPTSSPPPPSSNSHTSPPSSPPPSSNSHTSPPSSPPPSPSQQISPLPFGEVSASSSKTFLKRKGNKGPSDHVPCGQNVQSHDHHVPRQGNQGLINHRQRQGPRRRGRHRQHQPQLQSP